MYIGIYIHRNTYIEIHTAIRLNTIFIINNEKNQCVTIIRYKTTFNVF